MRFNQYLSERTQSSINRKDIESHINKQKNKYINKTVSIKDVITLLKSSVKQFDVKIFTKAVKTTGRNNIVFSGDFEDESINITVFYDGNSIVINDDNWNTIVKEFPIVIEHESIHIQQEIDRDYVMNRRVKSGNKTEKYLSDSDEIEAFANDISIQLLNKNNKNNSISILKKLDSKEIKKYYPLDLYINTFGRKHKIVKTLLKKIISIIEE